MTTRDEKIKKIEGSYSKKNNYKKLLFLTCLIIFTFMITYISFFAYEKKYQPKKIKNFQYSSFKESQDLGLTEPMTYTDTLAQCPPGQCAINMKTGIKRCPQNITNKLVYDMLTEVCTNLDSCDYPKLPYAVNLDGSATSNLCQKGPGNSKIACRCAAERTCDNHVMSKFVLVAGTTSNPNETSTSKSFVMGQEPLKDQDTIGYSNVTIPDPANQFCKLNPGFTNIVSPGCDFNNAVQDRLACDSIQIPIFTSTQSIGSAWFVAKQNDSHGLYSSTHSSENILKGQTYLIIGRNSVGGTVVGDYIPDSGLVHIGENQVSEIIKYSGVTRETSVNVQGDFYDYKVLTGITSVESSNINPIQGSIGFFNNFTVSGTDISMQVINLIFKGCNVSNSESNSKNMLLCVQNDNNICAFGNFSYNFDKFPQLKDTNLTPGDETFSRNFCQLNPGNNPNLYRIKYEEDPTYFTMSCGIGQGCDGKNFGTSITEDINLEALGRYFPDMDIDAINGNWELKINSYPYLNLAETGSLLNEFNIKPGDFWSINAINQILVVSAKYGTTPPNLKYLYVQNLFGLENFVNEGPIDSSLAPGIIINGNDYTLTEVTYTYDSTSNENTSTIYFTPALTEEVEIFTTIQVIPKGINSLTTTGMVSLIDGGGGYQLTALDGSQLQSQYAGIELTVNFYKQFGFCGGSYMTLPILNSSNNSNRRLYVSGNNEIVQYESQGNSGIPYPPQNLFFLNVYGAFPNASGAPNPYAQPEVPFKIPLSMYYPVWNPVLYQQECIRCKPLLLTYPQINSQNKIENIIIQFSGKDFSRYQLNKGNPNPNTYCFVSTSEINFEPLDKSTISSQRIVLKEPNNDVKIGDYVLDSTLQLPISIETSGTPQKGEYLQIVPNIFPSVNCIKQSSTAFNNCISSTSYGTNNPPLYGKSFLNFSYGSEQSENENFIYKEEFKIANQKIKLNQTAGSSWVLESNTLCNNYFFGKKYISLEEYCHSMSTEDVSVLENGFYFVPKQKVIGISQDKTVIEIDSPFPYEINSIPEENTLVQFCRLSSPLKLNVTRTNSTLR